MNLSNNKNFQYGLILIFLSAGIRIAVGILELGTWLAFVYGFLALGGFILMLKGVFESER